MCLPGKVHETAPGALGGQGQAHPGRGRLDGGPADGLRRKDGSALELIFFFRTGIGRPPLSSSWPTTPKGSFSAVVDRSRVRLGWEDPVGALPAPEEDRANTVPTRTPSGSSPQLPTSRRPP